MKYRAIVKVFNRDNSVKFLKYHTQNLISFTNFLDRVYPGWNWYNVFDCKSGNQVASFTKNNRPKSKFV